VYSSLLGTCLDDGCFNRNSPPKRDVPKRALLRNNTSEQAGVFVAHGRSYQKGPTLTSTKAHSLQSDRGCL